MSVPNDQTMDLSANLNVKIQMIFYWEVVILNVPPDISIVLKKQSGVILKGVIRYRHVLPNPQADFQIKLIIFNLIASDWLKDLSQ